MGGNRVLLDGRDVSQRVREPDVTEAASRVSVHPGVRQWMVARQQEMGAGGGVVMEGRDIGTKVFPAADVKIFLDADPVVREQRRLQQQNVRGAAAHAIAAELRERDRRDRTRATSPLVPASDALLLDSTQLSEDEVLQRVEDLVQSKLKTVKHPRLRAQGCRSVTLFLAAKGTRWVRARSCPRLLSNRIETTSCAGWRRGPLKCND